MWTTSSMAHRGRRERSVAFKLPPVALYISLPLRAFGYRSPGLIVRLSSWNATRHQPWGKNFLYLLLYSSVHRHFWTRYRSCAKQHIHYRGLEIRQYPTFALDQVKLWSKLKCHRAILFDRLIIRPHSPLGVLIASARSQSEGYNKNGLNLYMGSSI